MTNASYGCYSNGNYLFCYGFDVCIILYIINIRVYEVYRDCADEERERCALIVN